MKFILIALLSLVFLNCGTNPEVPAGHEGYIYESPRMFGNGGFQDAIVGPKNYGFSLFWNKAINVDYRPKTWTENYSVLSEDDLKISLSSHAIIKLQPGTVKNVVENLGANNWYERNIKSPLRTYVREAIQTRKGTEIKAELGRIGKEVQAKLDTLVKGTPFLIESIVIGNVQYPKAISDAVENKIKADQLLLEKETQKQIVIKDAEIAYEEAVGIKKAQDEISRSLTKNYLQYLAIKSQEKMANSPNNTVLYIPVGRNGIPIVHNK